MNISTPKSRLLYLAGEIDVKSTTDSIQSINEIIESDELISRQAAAYGLSYDPEPIQLNITSYGGDVYSMFGLVDTIMTSPVPVHTHAIGMCMSAALFIMSAGLRRSCTKNTTFMYHQISMFEWGSIKAFKDTVVEAERLEKMGMELLLDRTRFTEQEMLKIHETKQTFYFNSNEALKYGFVHEIK